MWLICVYFTQTSHIYFETIEKTYFLTNPFFLNMKNTLLLFIFLTTTALRLWGQKAEFYFSGGGLYSGTPTKQVEYDRSYSSYFLSDSITITTKEHVTTISSLVIKPKITFSAGMYLTRTLSEKLVLLYGIGGSYAAFNADNSIVSSDIKLLKIDTTQGVPSWNTYIGKRFVLRGEKPTLLKGTNYTIFTLDLPLMLRYNTRFQSFGVGIKASVPVLLNAYSESSNYVFVEETATEEIYELKKRTNNSSNPSNIGRVGVHVVAAYTAWMNPHFGLSIETQTQLNNLWSFVPTAPYYSNYSESNYKVRPSSLSLKLHYRF